MDFDFKIFVDLCFLSPECQTQRQVVKFIFYNSWHDADREGGTMRKAFVVLNFGERVPQKPYSYAMANMASMAKCNRTQKVFLKEW